MSTRMKISLKFLVPAAITAISVAGCVRGDYPIIRFENPSNDEGVAPITTAGWLPAQDVAAGYQDVFFTNDNVGFLTGTGNSNGVMRSTDGGVTWGKTTSSGAKYYNLFFLDDDHGWAIGPTTISYSTDAGITWQDLKSTDTAADKSTPQYYDAYFPNKDTGYATTKVGLLRSFDGGKNWKKVPSTPAGTNLVAFYNTKEGIVGTSSGIRFTDDSSKTFKSGVGPTSTIVALQILNTSEAICMDLSGTCWTSTDKGANWTRKLPINDKELFDVAFASLNDGYIMTKNKVFKVTNNTPQRVLYVPLTTSDKFAEFHFNKDLSRGWVIYDGGKLYRYVKP